MHILKLDATDSTNTFLKELARTTVVDDFTVVVTEAQTKGRGQLGNTWISEGGKNLTFSVLCRFEDLSVDNAFSLNYAVSLAIFNALKLIIPEKLTVKWPNDILSSKEKLCGILIENAVKNGKIAESVIGVGLNVNQIEFQDGIAATSLKIITTQDFDKDLLLNELLQEIKRQIGFVRAEKFSSLKETYESVLFKKGVPAMYATTDNNTFMGKIIGISDLGQLMVELEGESIQKFNPKEIIFL